MVLRASSAVALPKPQRSVGTCTSGAPSLGTSFGASAFCRWGWVGVRARMRMRMPTITYIEQVSGFITRRMADSSSKRLA